MVKNVKKDFTNVNFNLFPVMEMGIVILSKAVNVYKVGWVNYVKKNLSLVYCILNHVIIMVDVMKMKAVSAKKDLKDKIVRFWDLIVV